MSEADEKRDARDRRLVVGLVRVLIELTGGSALWTVADRHFADGVSIRKLAAEMNVPPSTLHRKLDSLFDLLDKHDALTPGWQRQPRITRKPKIISTSAELHKPNQESVADLAIKNLGVSHSGGTPPPPERVER